MEKLTLILEAQDKFSSELNTLKKSINDIEKSTGNLSGTSTKTTGSLTSMAGAFKAVAAAAAAFIAVKIAEYGARLAGSFVTAASTTEQYATRLKVLTGSQEESAKLFKQMSDYAAKTPFEYQEIMQAATALTGVMKGGVDEVTKWMPLIGDLAAASGLTIQETTEQVIRMYSAGAASADLFRERGILAMLGFQAGVSYSAEETKKKLIEAWEAPTSKFKGATEELSKTWSGAVSMLADKWFIFQNKLMNAGLFDWLKEKLNALNTWLDGLFTSGAVDSFIASFNSIGGIISSLKPAFMAIWDTIKSFISAWASFWDGFGADFGVAIRYIIDGVNTIAGELTGMFKEAGPGMKEFGAAAGEALLSVIVIIERVGMAVERLITALSTGQGWIQLAQAAQKAFDLIGHLVVDFLTAFGQTHEAVFHGIWTAFYEAAAGAFRNVIDVISGRGGKSIGDVLNEAMSKGMAQATESISSSWGKVLDNAKSNFGDFVSSLKDLVGDDVFAPLQDDIDALRAKFGAITADAGATKVIVETQMTPKIDPGPAVAALGSIKQEAIDTRTELQKLNDEMTKTSAPGGQGIDPTSGVQSWISQIQGAMEGIADSALLKQAQGLIGNLSAMNFPTTITLESMAAWNKQVTSMWGAVQKLLKELSDAPRMAKGGYVNKPTFAMIGEAGPEYVVPARQMGAMGGVNIGGITIHVANGDADTIAETVDKKIAERMQRRNSHIGQYLHNPYNHAQGATA